MQRDRWVLWLPVATIAGAAAWLLAPNDPPAWAPGAALLGALACLVATLWTFRHASSARANVPRLALASVFSVLAFAAAGACAAQVRTAVAAAPTFAGDESPRGVEGWIVGVDRGERGPRLRLLVRMVEGVEAPPRFARIAVPAAGMLTPGRAARCFAVLGAPAGPMAPGAYDFARRSYFEQLGASGFGFGRCRPAAFGAPPRWWDRAQLKLAAWRWDLSAAIIAAAPGRGGAIAAALVAGDRSAVDKETNDALTNSGLGHLLSVSGIHMGVVGGLVFGALVGLLALIAPIALRWPVKKIAAAISLLVLGAYLVVSGSSVPALRSYVMACVAFGAILLDRPAISMRGLALAALIVTLLFPESVLEPGFQMSFAATMALVALFESWKRDPSEPALPTPGPIIGLLQWSTRSIGGVILISVVAGIATDPFAIYHFQRFSLYALPANLIVAPIMSFLVAPAAGVAAVLVPFGLAELPLQIMASALDLVAAVGETFGARAEAVRAIPKPPESAFLLCVAALLWACLWRGLLRWGALLALAACIGLYLAAPRPVATFDGDLRAVFVKQAAAPSWALIASGGRSTYARDRMGAALGLSPAELERMAIPETCADALCVLALPGGRALIVVRHEEGYGHACVASAIVLSRLQAPENYAARCELALLVDAADLARLGGGEIHERDGAIMIARAWPPTTRRPWTPRAPTLPDQE